MERIIKASGARRLFHIVVLTGLCAFAAPSRAMNVAEFLKRADALKARGFTAIFHKSEINALIDEIKGAMAGYKADAEKAHASGDTSLGCPPPPTPKGQPPSDKARINSDELLARFRLIPAADQPRTPVKAAFYDFMKDRFPCK